MGSAPPRVAPVGATDSGFLWADTKVYWRYRPSSPERALVCAVGFACGFVLGYLFYGLWQAGAVLGVAVGFVAIRFWVSRRITAQMKSIRLQFRDLLESLATSLGAGRNIPDAFAAAASDMGELHHPGSDIAHEVNLVLAGLRNGVMIEDLLSDFAKRARVAEIHTFADIFVVVREKGGDMRSVVQNTYAIINEKIEIDLEVATTVAAAKSELNMMAAMPVLFALLLNGFGSLGGDGLIKYISTTVALGVFAAAWWVGMKMMDVEA
jgi:tight adherence protein B